MEKISIEQFAILVDTIPQNISDIKLGTAINFKWSIKDRRVAAITKFKFVSGEEPFILLDVLCSFRIEENDWNNLCAQDGSITVPKEFLCHIAMHTVGTARGVLHCKTESTPFNGLIIPPINVAQIIQEDIVVKV